MYRSTGGCFWPPTEPIVACAALLLDEAGKVAREIADLLLLEDEPLDVLGLPGERRLVDVDDREVRLRELLRDLRDRSSPGRSRPR